MLYDIWLRVAQERQNEFALRDETSGTSWTFAELRRAAEREGSDPGPLVCPQGSDAGFILKTLAAWRDGKVTCPLEPGHAPPAVPLPSWETRRESMPLKLSVQRVLHRVECSSRSSQLNSSYPLCQNGACSL